MTWDQVWIWIVWPALYTGIIGIAALIGVRYIP
jgi:hypothetical protein